MPRPGLLDVCRAQRHADFWSVMCAVVPSGRRRKREKRTNIQRDKSCFIPSLSASRPLTNATVARPRRSRAQHGLRAGARNLTCGSRGVRERGHARHGAEGSSRNDKSNADAHLEQARFDDVLDRPCERSAVKHNGVVVGDRACGVGRRRHARGVLVVSSGPKARSRWGVGGGLGVGRRAHEKAPGGRGRSSPSRSACSPTAGPG